MPDHKINLTLDVSRIKYDGAKPYIDVHAEDFGQVPPGTLAYWHSKGSTNPDQDIPVDIKLVGGGLPADFVEVRFQRPDGTRFVMMSARRLKSTDSDEEREAAGLTFGAVAEPASVVHHRSPKEPGKTRINARTFKDVHRPGHQLQPTLSDQLLFEKRSFPGAVPRKTQDAVKAAHRTSRAFVFDHGASYRVAEICAYSPDLIAEQQEFARSPYPKTFIELDAGAIYDAFGAAGLFQADTRERPDDRVGFLYTERGIYTAASHTQDDGKTSAGWSPFAYRPHQPMRFEQESRFCRELGVSRMQIDQWMWGNSYDLLTPTQRRSIRSQHGLDFLMPDGWTDKPAPLRSLLEGAGAGDMRLALCAALLLIRPNMLVTTEERMPGRRMVMGRPTTFLAHRVVTVKLSPDRLVSRIKRACKEERGRARARWHEVRGHYMHNHRAKVAGCVHDWEQLDPNKWECRKGCGGRRAWRTYPEGRGTAEVGVVTKHYVVKP